jgi:hypothetical protein
LQQVSGQVDDFLYAQPLKKAVIDRVTLRPGVAFTLRRFQHLLRELVRGAWVEYLRRLDKNRPILGEAEDLQEFLFGQPRRSLEACREPLVDLQRGQCFYCQGRLEVRSVHVDHFIPWTRFPSNLAHNLVATDAKCNGYKSNHLVAVSHLAAWRTELEPRGLALARALSAHGIIADMKVTLAITSWAYMQAERAGSKVWQQRREFLPLDPRWRAVLGART